MRDQLSFVWILYLIIVILAQASPAFSGSVLYVKGDAAGANNGSSWTDAYTSLQSALGAAAPGDEIWIAAGIYKPALDNNRGTSFVLAAGVGLYGGFTGTETGRDQRDWNVNKTVLSGEIGGGATDDNTYQIIEGADNARLDGLVITAGRGFMTNNGAAIHNNATSLTVANCNIHHNSTSADGGGIYNGAGASLTVSHCTFYRNGAYRGAAIYCAARSTLDLNNCVFDDNYSDFAIYGTGSAIDVTSCTFVSNDGAVSTYKSTSIFQKCQFLANTADCALSTNQTTATLRSCVFAQNMAGGMICDKAHVTLLNCVFSKNYAGRGGALYLRDMVSLVMKHCDLVENTAEFMGGGIYVYNSSPRIYNSILCANYAPPMAGSNIYNESGIATLYSCALYFYPAGGSVGDAGADGGGNIVSDPWLADGAKPAGADGIWMTADDGYGLRSNSPCRNAANAAYTPLVDILGNARVGAPDIGAYEYQPVNAVLRWKEYP